MRQALRGVKVHQIDGSKFDVYAAGAVLYSMIENSFPAHGGLSQISKRCPETLRWITRRAMAEYDRRYPSAAAMLADLRVVMQAKDPFALKPIDLPSVSQGDSAAEDMVDSVPAPDFDHSVRPDFARAGSPVPPRHAHGADQRVGPGGRVGRPQTSTEFWSGKYRVAGVAVATPQRKAKGRKGTVVEAGIGDNGPFVNVSAPRDQRRALRHPEDRASAREQVRSARARAQQRRTNATKRIGSARSRRRGRSGDYSNTPGVAVALATIFGLMVLGGGALLTTAMVTEVFHDDNHPVASIPAPPTPVEAVIRADDGMVVVSEHQGTSVGSVEADMHLQDLPRVQARLLLVPMLPQPIEPGLLEDLVAGTRVMQEQGVEFIGSVLPGIEDEASIDMTAALRNTLGSTPTDSVEYAIRVKDWVKAQSIDGVLLLLTRADDPENYRAMLVTDLFHTDIPLNEQAVPSMLNVLSGNGYTVEN